MRLLVSRRCSVNRARSRQGFTGLVRRRNTGSVGREPCRGRCSVRVWQPAEAIESWIFGSSPSFGEQETSEWNAFGPRIVVLHALTQYSTAFQSSPYLRGGYQPSGAARAKLPENFKETYRPYGFAQRKGTPPPSRRTRKSTCRSLQQYSISSQTACSTPLEALQSSSWPPLEFFGISFRILLASPSTRARKHVRLDEDDTTFPTYGALSKLTSS